MKVQSFPSANLLSPSLLNCCSRDLLSEGFEPLGFLQLIHKCGGDRLDDDIFYHVVKNKKVAVGVDVASESELLSSMHHGLLHFIARNHGHEGHHPFVESSEVLVLMEHGVASVKKAQKYRAGSHKYPNHPSEGVAHSFIELGVKSKPQRALRSIGPGSR